MFHINKTIENISECTIKSRLWVETINSYECVNLFLCKFDFCFQRYFLNSFFAIVIEFSVLFICSEILSNAFKHFKFKLQKYTTV